MPERSSNRGPPDQDVSPMGLGPGVQPPGATSQSSSGAGASTGGPSQLPARAQNQWGSDYEPASSDEDPGEAVYYSSESDDDVSYHPNRDAKKAAVQPSAGPVIHTQNEAHVDQNTGKTHNRTEVDPDDFVKRLTNKEEAAQSTNNEQGSSEAEASSPQQQQQPPKGSSTKEKKSKFKEDFHDL